MGEKDLTAKKLEDYEDVFCDILNVLLFHKDYIKPEQLRDGPTESIYKAGSKRNRSQLRDTFKDYEETGIAIAGFGMENEAKPEKPMVPRVFCYDAGAYMRQLKKKQPLRPVLTIVLNFSNKRWDQPKSMLELLNVPEEMKPFFQDYHIHVFDIAYLPDETIFQFKSTFRHVAHFFAHRRRDGEHYKPLNEEIEHLEEFLELIQVFTNDKRYKEIEAELLERRKKGEVITMDIVADTFTNRGIEIGRKEGRKEDIKNLVNKGFTLEQAIDTLCNSKAERAKFRKIMKKEVF